MLHIYHVHIFFTVLQIHIFQLSGLCVQVLRIIINMNHMQELRNVHVSCKCPLVVELHVVVDELCCYQEQDYNHWYDPTHCCALRISSVLGRLDVFTPVEVVFGHFWNYWKYFLMPDEQNQQMCVPVTEISQLSQGFIVRSYQWHKKDCRKG